MIVKTDTKLSIESILFRKTGDVEIRAKVIEVASSKLQRPMDAYYSFKPSKEMRQTVFDMLENEFGMSLCDSELTEKLKASIVKETNVPISQYDKMEYDTIVAELKKHKMNKALTAKALNMSRGILRDKCLKHGIIDGS